MDLSYIRVITFEYVKLNCPYQSMSWKIFCILYRTFGLKYLPRSCDQLEGIRPSQDHISVSMERECVSPGSRVIITEAQC